MKVLCKDEEPKIFWIKTLKIYALSFKNPSLSYCPSPIHWSNNQARLPKL